MNVVIEIRTKLKENKKYSGVKYMIHIAVAHESV